MNMFEQMPFSEKYPVWMPASSVRAVLYCL